MHTDTFIHIKIQRKFPIAREVANVRKPWRMRKTIYG